MINKQFHHELQRIGKLPRREIEKEKFNSHRVGERATQKQLSKLLQKYRARES